MRLKFGILATCSCLLACSLVSGKTVDTAAVKDDSSMVPKIKPTTAPLHKSTVKPTFTSLKPGSPTKAMVLNVPPNANKHIEDKNSPMITYASQSENTTNDLKAMPQTSNTVKAQETKTDLVSDIKPVQVTGFITRNGNIYEIEDRDGIGLIEGRQAIDEKTNICNYGNIVIYSDVPCEEVTNVRVGDVVQSTLKDEKDELQGTQNQQQQQQLQQQLNQNDSELELDDVEESKPPRRLNGQKRRRNQKNQIRRRPNKNRKRQKTTANRNQQRRRHQPTQQRRRKQQLNRRRLQNQRYPTQRRKHNNRNRIQQHPRRRHRKRSSSGQNSNMNRNRRRNQRLQQARRRQQEYGRGHFDYEY